ncbi:hypothetical protein WJX72_009542 [[Myrmecia] bisecta]|uniref:6-phosphogluconate dehydrogenase n=1 Tax=[Myrmecia] bisecta TaxID=41462 RepID=A0AAW1QAR1_9CHLO
MASQDENYLTSHPKPGSTFVDCSTVYPTTTEENARKAQQASVYYLASPVFGRPDLAAAKKLVVVTAGTPDAKPKVKPYQEAMGRAVLDVGERPQLANVAKLTGNFCISSIIEMLGEAMTLADKNGLDRKHLVAIIDELFPSPIIHSYVTQMAADRFQPTPENPGFHVRLALKDLGHILRLGQKSGAPLPVAEIMMGHLKDQAAAGREEYDWAAIALSVRKAAGIKASEE